MRDEISFRSLMVKSNNEIEEDNLNGKIINNQNEKYPENYENFFLNKQKSNISNVSSSNLNNNSIINLQNKSDSKVNKVKIKIKEYFEKNNQLNKKDFNSFLSFIGLSDIWSGDEQMFLWETITSKVKRQDNFNYEETLSSICEFFEDDEEEEEIIDKKSPYFDKINNSYLDVSANENCIDEYLSSIKDNIKLLFGIKFINEIFLKHNNNSNNNNNNGHGSINTINTLHVNNSLANGINYDLDKSDVEGENEIENNKFEKKTIINLNDIMNEIKNKYRFILITYEELNNYLNNLKKNLRKSESISNNIVLKNDKKQEISLDKELINYVSAMIELKLDSKIKNEDIKNIKADNEEIDSSKDLVKNNGIIDKEIDNRYNNDVKDNNNKIEGKKIIFDKEKDEISYDQVLKEFNLIDIMISDCYGTIANLNRNKDLINLIKIYNEHYIMIRKKILYNRINKLILENKIYLEEKQKREESKINEININSNKKILVDPDDENDYLRQQNKNLKERNDYLLKENQELKENISKNITDVSSSNNNIMINKINFQNTNIQGNSNNNNFYTFINQKHFRNKTEGDENILLNNIKNQNILKNNLNNNNNLVNNSGLIIESDQNINSNNTNNKIVIPFTKTNTNSFNDCNIEEIVNSHSEMFSIIGNNTSMLNDKFLFETTELGNGQNLENTGTLVITPKSNIFDIKDDNNSSFNNIFTPSSKISDINSDSVIYGKKSDKKKKNIKKNNILFEKDLIMKEKKYLNVNDFNNNKFTFGEDNINGVIDLKYKLERKSNYDFKYLSQNRKISKLLSNNYEKLKSSDIFSDQVNFILNGNKKKKGILLITSQNFYILDENNDMNCELRIDHKLLSYISIPEENFNHLLLFFNENCFIIIEIYRRIDLLNYLKDLYIINKYKKIDIYFCDSFNIKINNHSFLYEFKNNKDIILTPNFENAQKMGFLKKYKENIFSGYFSEKLVVLCCIGLVVFSKSNISIPKLVIPVIGSSIKPMTAETNERLFCFKLKTINNEIFLFGSNKNREINDWIQELKNYQKLYETKMKDIMSNFIIHSKEIKEIN